MVSELSGDWLCDGGLADALEMGVYFERVEKRAVVMREFLGKHEGLFPQKLTPGREPTDEDVPK
jgi:hypothetical protein